MQPTGDVHLGNYLGALKWWVADQYETDGFYPVVDLHALTVPGDPAELREATQRLATLYLAIGLNPDVSTIFLQSHVPAHTQLTWVLECTASMGELRRMTQFKDKAAREGEESARVGLFAYPILMAADILAYDADRVPVGDDQRQHLELTRDLAQRWNARYGDTFVVPEAAIPAPGRAARVMDLQHPTAKMSKSADSPQGTISLLDDPEDIERKVRRAVTDTESGPRAVRWDREGKPGVSNLLEILATLTGRNPEEVAADYEQYGPLKADTAEAIIEATRPIRARYQELIADPAVVSKVLRAGAERANEVASATVARAYDAIGLLPPT